MASLWMGDLDSYMDEAFIKSAFAAMGEAAVSVKMIKNRATGSLAGYCFVDFGDISVAQKIMTKLNGLPVPGSNPIKRFKLNWATYGKETNTLPEYSIFVGDLSPDVTDSTLQEFFQRRYSSCRAAKVVLDSAGNSRGYGFVRFCDDEEHRRAMVEMQGAEGCGAKPLRVSAATPKRPQATAPAAQNGGYSTSTANTATQQYMQQYQQYQQYLAAWQGYQQQTQYYQQYQQGYQQPSYGQTTYQQHTDYEEPVMDNTAEDPSPPLDIESENKQIITREADLYFELEQSRWYPVEMMPSATKSVVT